MLREAMFANGILYNSEAWHGVTEMHIEKLSKVDHQLMRFLLSAHSKVPLEFLYLETGTKPVKFVVSSRRLNYLTEIHMREDHELIKRIYKAQKNKPHKGDWSDLVNKDLKQIEISEESLKSLDKISAKSKIKNKINKAAFEYLTGEQKENTKVKTIVYNNYEMQKFENTQNIKHRIRNDYSPKITYN